MNKSDPSPALPSLTGRALQLFWSAAAEFDESGRADSYLTTLAELLAELEIDAKKGDPRLIADGIRVVWRAAQRDGLSIPGVLRLLAMIGLDESALEQIERGLACA